MTDKNFIICSAVYSPSYVWEVSFNPKNIEKGIVVYWPRHSHCYEQLSKMCNIDDINHKEVIHWFVTSQNMFVDRYEWYKIAKNAWQLICKRKEVEREMLFSEDLY